MTFHSIRIDEEKEEVGSHQADDADGEPSWVFLGSKGWAGGQIQGAREEQQDCFAWLFESALEVDQDPQLLLLVADGMGGHSAGARASDVATTAFTDSFGSVAGAISECLEEAIHQANAEVRDIALREDTPGMGTTLVVAHIIGGRRLRWLSVGDSPLWLVKGGSSAGTTASLVRLNQDHSMKPILQQLVDAGDLTADEAANDRRRHELRSAVAGDEIRLMDFREDPVELAAGDMLILATDGLQTLADDEIAQLATASDHSPDAVVERMLRAVRARSKPGQDNTTVMVYVPPEPDSDEPTEPVGDQLTAPWSDQPTERASDQPLNTTSEPPPKSVADQQPNPVGGKGRWRWWWWWLIAPVVVAAALAAWLSLLFGQHPKTLDVPESGTEVSSPRELEDPQ